VLFLRGESTSALLGGKYQYYCRWEALGLKVGGAMGEKNLVLAKGELFDTLPGAFEDILSYAEGCLELDAEKAVHEFRKSVRRARSLVKLLRDGHAGFGDRRITPMLRSAFRATNELRDTHVLEGIAKGVRDFTTPDIYEFVMPLLASTPASEDDVMRILNAQIPILKDAVSQFHRSFPADFNRKHLRRGYRASYARTRKRIETFQEDRGDDAFHDLRKRIKELRYQIEMLVGFEEEFLESTHEGLVKTAKAFGEVTDLMVLRDYLREYIQEAEPWADALSAEIEVQQETCTSDVRALLSQTPRQFARRVIRGIPRENKQLEQK